MRRKREYKDVYISDKDLSKLRKGYTVLKLTCGIHLALHRRTHDRAVARKIEKLKLRIKELESKKGKR